jgi:hypothetical protein
MKLYLNGDLKSSTTINNTASTVPITIGTGLGSTQSGLFGGNDERFEGIIKLVSISSGTNIPEYNSLATLPLYTFDASKYPTSSGWTANVPYSSMTISSGEFSFTDDGQLQCDSTGSFTLRNAHPFDSDEYIKVIIDGTEYAGTGSVTQGTVTVSITQGSNVIDVEMDANDMIDSIYIQFREPV